jgi:hypothetical protein
MNTTYHVLHVIFINFTSKLSSPIIAAVYYSKLKETKAGQFS